jgi:hypothetical protein
MPPPPRPDSWKNPGQSKPNSPPPSGKPAPNTSRRPWQPGAPKAKTTGKPTSRVAKFVAAGVGVGLLTAAVVWVVMMLIQPKYPSVVVVAPDADTLAIPENAAGVASAKAVEEWATGDPRAKLTAGHDATAERDSWKNKLDGNSSGLVLYFAAHAGADAEKGAYLWQPPKGGAISKADKLYVADILQRLAELPKSQPKLLVFDVSQTPSNWAFGGAYSDFIRSVKGMDTQIEGVGELAVLLSADEDQVSWIADERRMSAFGFYFTEGVRGGVGTPGGSVTAAALHGYLKTEVQKWAVANRGANQEPVLLPKASGTQRAEKLKLTTLPATPTPATASPEPAAPTPPALLNEWKRVGALAKQVPSPDTTDPLKWREYLEWLMRWDRLVRLNGVPNALASRVQRLGDELANRTGDDVACGTVALPAGVALSGPSGITFADGTFAKLWDPPEQSDHAAEWGKIVKDADPKKELALRTAVARFVVKSVTDAGVSRGALESAEKVLRAVGGVQPVEAHFVRMLHLHLPGDPKARTAEDLKKWPSADLLRSAINTRITAEEAAWADGLAYPEQAFRWSFPLVEAADRQRQTGEDLLFDTDPKTRPEAADLFDKAGKGYTAAKGRAKAVADALAARDKVFARMPYYARWVASARGGPVNTDELMGKLERAASAAYQIDKFIRDVPTNPTDADVNSLVKATKDAALISEVAVEYDLAAKQPGGQVQESNWHALDAAQVVPFRTLDLDKDLAQRARTVAVRLATDTQQPGGTRATDPDPLNATARNLRAAAAYLNDPALARSAGLGEKPVKLADQLADNLHGLPAKATTATVNADARDNLRDTVPELSVGNRLARLCDPAAPVGGSPAPPEADRRFWRHYFLLAHARRITHDGWCSDNPAEANVSRWYCSVAAKLVHDSADAELRKLVPGRDSLPDVRKDRLTSDLSAEHKRTPTELEIRSAATRVIVPDERHLRYTYEANVKSGERIGLPVAEYALPPALAKVNPDGSARRLERRLAEAKVGMPVPQAATFAFPASPAAAGADTLAAALRYRGRVYRADTQLTFADKPNLRVENVPPRGSAVMALQADADAVSGAVTLLIDVTNSMSAAVAGTPNNRLEEAFIGVEELLNRVPPGTQLRIGTFVGSKPGGGAFAVDVRTLVPEFRVKGGADERKRVMEQVREAKLVDPSCTPVAGAIAFALDPKLGATLWPKNFTGGRTLIVLTDGDDNWEEFGTGYADKKGKKATPGDAVKEAIADAVIDPDAADVTVHLALFAMDAKAIERAKDQFEFLETAPELQDRGRFRLIPKVKSGADFANQMAQAVMPRVRYKSDRHRGVMVASRKDEADADKVAYNPTPPLKPGSFTLTDGVHKLPLVQLDAGERVIVRAVRHGEKIHLTRPPLAYELAKAEKWRMAEAGNVALTIPEIKYERSTPRSRIEAVVTLEELDPALATDVLKAPSRYFAWFDLKNPDGSKFDPNTGPQVTIRNKLEAGGNELLAPAWDIKVNAWDPPGRDADRYRRPQITAHWLNGLPDPPLDVQNITPGDVQLATPDALPLKAFKFGAGQVGVLDAAVTEREKQLYLSVWMDYKTPGELVFLRVVGDWKAGRVGESHTYYDRHARYTAEFGPFSSADLVTPLRLELYSVADLRKHAEGNKRAVTLKGDESTTDRFTLPRRLFLAPQE